MTFHHGLTVPKRAKLKVKDYLLLSENGAFDDYARVELIEGEVWIVNAVYRRHAQAHAALTVAIGIALKQLGSELILYTTPATELSEDSLPEPDITLAEPTSDNLIPGAATRLAIEIADSTLSFDLGRKARLYARTGMPEYWVVDLKHGTLHQMWGPTADGFMERRQWRSGEAVTAATIPGLTVTPSFGR